jgi:glycosyltransferase involved in cell wall biosynthesis
LKVVYVTAESYIDHGYTIIKELGKHIDMPVYLQAKELTGEISVWCKHFNAEFIPRKRFRNPFSVFSEISFLMKIKKHNPDVVWFNTLTVYQVFLVRLFIKNFLVVMHDVELHPESKDKHASLSVRLTLKYFKKQICVVSHTQAGLYKNMFGIQPLVFQLPVIDYYKNCERENTEKELNPNSNIDKIRFFFFGSVEAYKGIEILIDACKILEAKQDLPEFEVNIYGKVKYNANELIKEIKELKSATLINKFIDYRDIHTIYKDNDVLILPYKQVTQCGPLLIGYSENIPSICSDLPGFREYVDDGKTGLIFDNTSMGLAEKMEEIIKNPTKIVKLKENITAIVLEKFSMKNLCKDYISNFEKAVTDKR